MLLLPYSPKVKHVCFTKSSGSAATWPLCAPVVVEGVRREEEMEERLEPLRIATNSFYMGKCSPLPQRAAGTSMSGDIIMLVSGDGLGH